MIKNIWLVVKSLPLVGNILLILMVNILMAIIWIILMVNNDLVGG